MATASARTALEMVYKTDLGKDVTYSLSDPQNELAKATVDTYMASVIAKNIYNNKAGKLVTAAKAQIVTTKIDALV